MVNDMHNMRATAARIAQDEAANGMDFGWGMEGGGKCFVSPAQNSEAQLEAFISQKCSNQCELRIEDNMRPGVYTIAEPATDEAHHQVIQQTEDPPTAVSQQ